MLLSFFNMFSEESFKVYFYNGYVPQVDVACSFLCLAVFLLLSRSFTRKNLDYKLLRLSGIIGANTSPILSKPSPSPLIGKGVI